MLELFFFLLRYTPFWAIPLIFISGEFGLRYFLKKKRPVYIFCLGVIFFSFLFLAFYFYAGGPEKSVRYIIKMFVLNEWSL